MAAPIRVAAVDLGASSGRVMVGVVAPGRLELTEIHRFPNAPITGSDGSLHWNIDALYAGVLDGLAAAGPVDAVGVDSWGVDYGLLDVNGRPLGLPFAYRDGRTGPVIDAVRTAVGVEDLYAATGIQHLPFNTIFQLAAETNLAAARTMLLIPDLIGYRLTGSIGAEATNASTTQLYDVRTRTWATGIARRAGVPVRLLPPLREPGTVVGGLLPQAAHHTGQRSGTPVIAVGSHDTASAVVAVPVAAGGHAAYISSGTWSLVGLELAHPVLTEDARRANFTNEAGVDATTRFLRNVMGLWVLSQAMQAWGTDDIDAVLAEAAAAPAHGAVVDIDAPEFLPPGDMQSRIRDACLRDGQVPPSTRGETARSILESLALAYRRTVRAAGTLSGRRIDTVHVVGGGSRNALLCQMTADACGLAVSAGPVEATAVGNVLVQARALGADLPDLAAMRDLVRSTHEIVGYEPFGEVASWDEAEAGLMIAATEQGV